MAEAMVGRDVSHLYPAKGTLPKDAEAVLQVKNLTVPGYATDISFDLRRGEILGISGMIGSGRTETMEGLCGLRRATAEHVKINGVDVHITAPKQALAHGLCYLTEDRKGRGLLLNKSMRENLTLQALDTFGSILIDQPAEEKALATATQDFDIRATHKDVKVGNMSGGNQQKLLIAKTMLSAPQIMIIDEPTRGIDIGTKQQIYEFIRAQAAAGKSVIVISSEMQEVIGLADRVIVMREGRIAGTVTGNDIAEEPIVRLAMGLAAQNTANAKEPV
ncbi:MAG: ribose transport system ATP-binding protein [Paracoccaceae bacterium]|jgi:ribose transport system ATP-binding protein